MRVLLTGGAGYVGSACMRYMLRHGHDVTAFDDLSRGHSEAVPEARLIVGDILNAREVAKAIRSTGAEAVMHFAAIPGVSESVDRPGRYYQVNVDGTRCVLQAMKNCGVQMLIFSSTCSVYGPNDEAALDEQATMNPCNPYARTKLVNEWMIADCAKSDGFSATIFRYFNAAGGAADGKHGEDYPGSDRLLPNAFDVALKRREGLSVFGGDYATPDGTCVRDYVHVDDIAQAHVLALEGIQFEVETYNIGTGNPSSVLDVIHACEAAAGVKIPYSVTPRRQGDAPALAADASKIRAKLGWEPVYPDIESIARTAWEWHRSHPRGYAT